MIDLFYSDCDDNLLVVELKVSRAYDRVVGQLLRYMGWVKKYHAEDNQQIRGLIIGDKITQDLLLAVSMVPNVEYKEYDKSVSLPQSHYRPKMEKIGRGQRFWQPRS